MGRKLGGKKPQDITEVEARIGALKGELRRLDSAQRERLGRIAFAAGLANVRISDAELEAAFRHLAATFSAETTEPAAGS